MDIRQTFATFKSQYTRTHERTISLTHLLMHKHIDGEYAEEKKEKKLITIIEKAGHSVCVCQYFWRTLHFHFTIWCVVIYYNIIVAAAK